ncbi:hypothetical protein CcCBS67573_g00768 [Chytriomyces confervae]|uniref:VWFA domain-containing protein n=1 Tax=Chytriomyces confervae TaxID=246404 RepID=A0A507FNC8_9FUNG|nr:hypothetical protein HDU80_002880 [Chytriomyces hyalinus]TPX77951.1 hypothetical protein CcCBS67573_g00768 [Chytriomyces confervae]
MRFSTQIAVRLILPIVVGSLLITAGCILFFMLRVPRETNALQETLAANELRHFCSNAQGAATLVDAVFAQFARQISAAARTARNSLGTDGAQSDPLIAPPANIYTSYFAGTLDNATPPLPQDPALYSALYQNNITTLAQFNARMPDPTSVLDNVFRPAVLNQPKVRGIQMGFADTAWRIYPLVYNQTSFDPRASGFCQGEAVSPDLKGSSGFKPLCRQFYLVAANSNLSSSTENNATPGLSKPVFTNPYPAAVSGQLLVSASVALFRSGRLYGVLALQILVETLANKLANTPILNNGYIYIIDNSASANIIMFPKSRTAVNIYNADRTTPLSEVEFRNDTTLTSAFLTQVRSLLDKQQSGTYLKPDGSGWTFAAASVRSTSHILIVTAPNSDISALSDNLRTAFTILLAAALSVAIFVALLAAFCSYRITNSLAKKIIKPIDDMVEKLGHISKNRLDIEFEAQPLMSRELNNVNENFKNLLTAVRFGNNAYYADNLQLALENYLTAETLMIKLGNKRGEGVCSNNLGNVYRMIDGQFQKASLKYTRAIEIATLMLDSPKNSAETQLALKTVLANRLNNMGVLWKENFKASSGANGEAVLSQQHAEMAETYFTRSLSLHRQTDNLEGIAQVSGNIGQLYLTQNRIPEAAELLTDAFNLIRKRNDNPIALQYACMNMGLLAEKQGNFQDAATWYLFVLQRFNVVVAFVQKLVLERLIALCEETREDKGVNRPELAKVLKELAAPLFNVNGSRAALYSRKDITFVLDTSGSMSGAFIRTCRQSIKTIITETCAPDDILSLIKFDHNCTTLFTKLTKADPTSLQQMMYQIDTNTEADGGTAFYEAIVTAMTTISRNSVADRSIDTWIVALTDGDDYNSNKRQCMAKIQNIFQKGNSGGVRIGIIVITVGNLTSENDIRTMLAFAGEKRGLLIRSEASSDGIRDAFGKAVKVMQGGEVSVESL